MGGGERGEESIKKVKEREKGRREKRGTEIAGPEGVYEEGVEPHAHEEWRHLLQHVQLRAIV